MTENKLGKILKKMYDDAPEGLRGINAYLFGIEYGDKILESHLKVENITNISGIDSKYKMDVRKGIILSKYVLLK
jgi:5-methylcytosine-specific restriction protein B